MMTSRSAIVEADNICVSFASKAGMINKAVDNISISLHAGETLAVVGESGSGKTTLLRALLGLADISSGRIALFGHRLSETTSRELTEIRRRCGYVPQDPYGALPPGLSVLAAVMEPAVIADKKLIKDAMQKRAEALLDELGLHGDRILCSRAVGLSGGQRQRVEIARALMLEPELLLCDEPTSMQDVSTRGEIIEVLDRRVDKGMSMIFVTHDLVLAGCAAERVMVMKNGSLCEEGSSAEVLGNPSHPYTKALIEAIPKISELKQEEQK
jgi:peptide/nickel transport system ATP-binding protein